MKVFGSSNSGAGRRDAAAHRSEQNEKRVDSALDPLSRSLKNLAQFDRMAPALDSGRINTNLKNGYEALVHFKTADGGGYVLSVRDADEVPLYESLLAGTSDDPATSALYQDLNKASNEENRYFLKRQGEYLPTDPAAAAILLRRGSRVVIQRNDGVYETHRKSGSALRFLDGADPEAAKDLKSLREARATGLQLSPYTEDLPRESQDSGFLGRLQQAFERPSELDIEKELLDSLRRTGKLNAAFQGDERPLPLPLTLDDDEFKIAARWPENPTRGIKRFKNDFQELSGDDCLFMTEQASGDMKGMVVRADDRATYFQLRHGNRVVALDKKGDLHELNSLASFKNFKMHGRAVPPTEKLFDGGKTPSDNLMMMYHVSPFDPIEKGNYDDLPQRITSVGSNEQVDIVAMRSDLPTKRNLRVDRVQDGQLQEIKRLDPATAMSDPKVLEDFVYETVSQNQSDRRIRFLVGGHGGAEKGLLPDGEHNNSAADQAMPVDKFAGAISKALDRVEKETGKRPKIDNLMLVSCLMGNTSFIHALAQTGDVESLVASPELMAGTNPLSTFEYLKDPKTSQASGLEYAQHLVDEWSVAPAMIGGNLEHHHADTIGAYDLSPEKQKRFQKALNNFFQAAIDEPKYAEYLKEGIAKAPTYGINPLVNVLFDVDNRDLLQVLDHTCSDARIKSKKLKAAMKELKEATEAQVITQKVSENYQGRRGPSLYLPLDKWDFNEKMARTDLLQSVPYKEFMDMVFEAPLHRGVRETLLNEVSRLSETGALDKATEKLKEVVMGARDKQDNTEKNMTLLQENEALDELYALEEKTGPRLGRKLFETVKGGLSTAVGVAAGAIGGALSVVPGALFGAYAGAKAGWTGVSGAGTHKPASSDEVKLLSNVVDELLEANGMGEQDTAADHATVDLKPLQGLWKGRVAKGIQQLLLWPSEGPAIWAHQEAGKKFGELPGRLLGSAAGALSGALLNGLACGAAAFAGVGIAGAVITNNKLSKLAPQDAPKGKSLFLGRFKPEAEIEKENKKP